MRIDRYSYGALPTPTLSQNGAKNREAKRFDSTEETPNALDPSQVRRPVTEVVSFEQRASHYEDAKRKPNRSTLEEYVHVGEYARGNADSPRAARALAVYQNLAQLPQREQLTSLFGIDTYA